MAAPSTATPLKRWPGRRRSSIPNRSKRRIALRCPRQPGPPHATWREADARCGQPGLLISQCPTAARLDRKRHLPTVVRLIMRTSDDVLAELKTLHPRSIDLSLGRIETLLAKLGAPQERLPPVIHVAGTNGKGSFTAFLKAMLEAAGKRVHTYTSPHLVRFHERIAIAGADGKARPIGEDELVERLRETQRVNA